MKRLVPIRFAWMTLILCIGTLASAETSVRIVSNEPVLAGRNVTVLKKNDSQSRYSYENVDVQAALDSTGTCSVLLPEGVYRFEIFDGSILPCLCVRTEEIEVATTPVTVPIKTQQVSIRAECEGQPLVIGRVAIRSLAPKGEVLREFQGARTALLRTSPNVKLDVMVAAYRDDLIAVGWTEMVSVPAATLQLGGQGWQSRQFAPHPENPPLSHGYCRLMFPRNQFEFPLGDSMKLVTNLPTMRMQYALRSTAGDQLVSRVALVNFHSDETVLLGGPLKPLAYAQILKKFPKGKHLVSNALLVDASGREIDLEASKVQWKSTPTLRGRFEIPKNPLDESELGVIANPEDTMQYHVQWRWTKSDRESIHPSPFVRYASPKFAFNAPQGWNGRANLYLEILENSSLAMRAATSRRGPGRTWVMWRLNTHNAKAQVGGSNPWMSMPFKGLRSAKTPSGFPQFLLHEMAHTFGYNHGKKMNEAIGKSREQKQRDLWELPEGNPNIEVLEAMYGVGSRWVDVSDFVREIYESENPVLHHYYSTYPVSDPAPKKSKHLRVRYSVDGTEKSVTAKEGKKKRIDLKDWLR